MKKLIYISMLCLLINLPVSAQTPTPTQSCLNTGDVNFDNVLSFGDSQIAFMIAMGIYSPTEQEFCAADCNGDGNVTAGDA